MRECQKTITNIFYCSPSLVGSGVCLVSYLCVAGVTVLLFVCDISTKVCCQVVVRRLPETG